VAPVADTKGIGAVVMHFNITEQKLREERDTVRVAALDLASYPLLTADSQGIVDWANRSFLDLLGVEKEDVIGQHPARFEMPGNPLGFAGLFQKAKASGAEARGELRLMRRNGSNIVAMQTVAPLASAVSGEVRFVVTGEDITEQRINEARMMYSTEHDELTGLLNRKSVITRLEAAIERQREAGGTVVLLFLDLDRFKDTNDTLGHLVGDQILVEAANRLQQNVPSFSHLARFGGDEFVLIVENPGSADDVDLLVERLLLAFSRPVMIDGRPLQSTASIGIAHYPRDAASAEELLRTADLAMYRAKADGRRRFRRFDQQIQQEIEDRVLIERDLTRALGLKDLWVAFQPQVDLATRRVVGAEALLRWNRQGQEETAISKVIHVAEESGLILPIGQWMMREAIQQLARWQAIEPDLKLSVNLSAVQFNQQDVFAQIMEHLGNAGVPANRLKVEITETVLLNRSTRVKEALHALHGAGIGLHLDDFGTGYSSLSYLQQFPIEAVKIDGSFVAGVGREAQDEAIVNGIVKLAQALNIHAVAEGVENECQVKFLEKSGCHLGQGFHWAKPLPAEEFTRFLSARALGVQ
jgi:diguanylate cyclase (GGDEF)-like protein/PAS domain S-box-containing protein